MSATQQDRRLEPLIEAGITIATGLEIEAVLGRLLELARELTGARYAAVGVLDEARTRITRFITSGIDDRGRAAIGHPPVGRGILGVLITEARPLRLSNIAHDSRSSGFPANHPPMRTFLGVPVKAAGTVFGNLYLTEKDGGGDFTEEDEQVMVMLAAQAGVVVQNAALYRESTEHAHALERAVAELSSIHEIAEAILADAPKDEVLALIAERAQAGLGAHAVGIALPDATGTWLHYEAAAGEGAERLRGLRLPIGRSKLGTAFRARRSVLVRDLAADPDTYAPAVEAMGLASQIIVPLVHRAEVLGVMTAGERERGQLGDDDRRMLEAFATRAVLALVIGRALAAERERAEAEARLMRAELREASRQETLRRVVDAQEQERRRIARELHDETGQALASVLMGLRRIEQETDPDAVSATVADLRETVTAAIRELRALAVELRPKALDDFGLAPALERLTDTYAGRTGIAVDLQLVAVDGRLPGDVETAVYRIVQEGLTNVAKHARARHVSVVVRRAPSSIVLVLEDDGRGFDPAQGSGGLGLVSMQERAELVSGSFRLETAPGSGTTIAVEVPV
jgi:signal transduction histidine kinase